MTLELVLIALAMGSFVGLAVFMLFQLWQWKSAQDQADDEAMLDRMVELAEYHEPGESLADTAIRVAKQRKDAQRRARQRKAKRRQQ